MERSPNANPMQSMLLYRSRVGGTSDSLASLRNNFFSARQRLGVIIITSKRCEHEKCKVVDARAGAPRASVELSIVGGTGDASKLYRKALISVGE